MLSADKILEAGRAISDQANYALPSDEAELEFAKHTPYYCDQAIMAAKAFGLEVLNTWAEYQESN